jgi:capsid assembly protease
MQRSLPHVFGRVFNTPLAMPPARLEPLIAGLRAASLQRGSLIIQAMDQEPPPPPVPVAKEGIVWDYRTARQGYVVSPKGVAWVPVRGVLTKREGEVSADSHELESYARVGNRMRAAASNSQVRGIMLDVDSVGGEIGGLFELARDIRTIRTIKPVWAIANDDALSAGYALASSASRVWTTSVGGLGSIGVVAMHTDQSAFDAARGLTYTYIFAGAHKVDGNSHEPLSDAARESTQAEVNRIFGMFAEMVAATRGISVSKVQGFEAEVFFGQEAVGIGLADQVGTFAEAVNALGNQVSFTGSSIMAEHIDTPPGDVETPIVTLENVGTVESGAGNEIQAGQTTAAVTDPIADASVISLDAVRAATGTVRAEAGEIASLCALAGFPALAADFITKGTALHLVRQDLQRRKAEADEARQIEAIDVTPKPAAASNSELQQVVSARFASQMGRKP